MASAPPKACRCGGKIINGTCDRCGTGNQNGWQSDKVRGTRKQRGYGEDWLRLRRAHLADNPLCADCLEQGRGPVAAEHVDHVKPFRGEDDPKRLDRDNLRSLCRRCHMRKTAKSARR